MPNTIDSTPSNEPKTLTLEEARLRVDGSSNQEFYTEQLDVETAKVLASFKGDEIQFMNLKSLDAETAQELAKFIGDNLHLIIKKIDVATAEALSEFKGAKLTLETQIDANIAEALVKFKGENLTLVSSRVNTATAKALAMFNGVELHFYIGGIDAPAIEALAEFNGNELRLELSEKEIDPPMAKAMALFNGKTINLGNSRISEKAASEFLKFRGRIESDHNVNEDYDDPVDLISSARRGKQTHDAPGVLQTLEGKTPEWIPLFEQHPNFKALVMEEGQEFGKYLRENGVPHPEYFQNLNANPKALAIAQETLEFLSTLENGSGIKGFSEAFKSATLADFQNDPKFIEIHLDETIHALAYHLGRLAKSAVKHLKNKSAQSTEERNAFLRSKIDDPAIKEKVKIRYRKDLEALLSREVGQSTSRAEENLKRAETLFDKLNSCHFIRPGQSGFKLASRNTKELTLGDECSDCTSASIGGMNFWTVPTWLTDPGFNFLLQYDENGNLAHKFGVVLETLANGEIILTLDSMEVGNSQKPGAGMYEEVDDEAKESELMEESISFIRKWAAMIGIKPENIYASTFSNTGTTELDGKYPKAKVLISKLGALSATERILKKTNPEHSEKPKIYLQSYKTGEGIAALIGGGIQIETGDRNADFGAVEAVIANYLKNGSSDSSDFNKFKQLLELAHEKHEEAGRKMGIFLTMEAKPETKQALSAQGKRIDVFLNSRGHSLKTYFGAILGRTDLTKTKFVQAELFHLAHKETNSIEGEDSED